MMERMTHIPSDGRPSEGMVGASDQPALEGWLSACARGDEQAFGRLYDATAPRVFGLVLRILRDRAQSEEVTQEVYHQAWLHSARFDPERGSALAWLLTLAHRRAVDRVRAAEAATRRDVAYEARTRPTAYDETAETVENRIEARRVRAALDRLSDKQRDAIELAYFGGHTHTEVAGILDVPLGTTKTRIRDGLLRLRDTLGMDR